MTQPPKQESESGSAQLEASVPVRRFVLYFLRLGTTGFGGPIATVG